MTIFFAVLALLFFLLYLNKYAESKNINREIAYLRQRISSDFYSGENGHILLPSTHTEIRELAAALNRFLDNLYLQKTDYETSRRAMVAVLTDISHDLRTPLTVLRGYGELLAQETKSPEVPQKIRDMSEKLNRKAKELVDTIHDYLAMSKIESEDISLQLQKVNITQICHDTILDYYDILEKMQCQVEISMEEKPVFALADEDALRRILKNLLDNAVKHGGEGNYLGIRLTSLPEKTIIEVEDHGKGIIQKDLEQIFSRNYTTAGKNAGNGLGLTIARNLARKMEGEILVKSTPGKQTVFTLVLKS